MPQISPSVTAYTAGEYRQQMEKVGRFAERLHIDLMDGQFTPKANVRAAEAWWPVGIKADFHLMYQRPEPAIRTILEHQPNMVIIHAEADGNFKAIAELCRRHKVKVGLALLQKTAAEDVAGTLPDADHVLIFSGDLGSYGGQADLGLLKKVAAVRAIRPDIEIGWDGGVSPQNISQLAFGGVDVFDVGAAIQKADDPEHVYQSLQRIAEETGTT